jgi:hypothetical protein
MHAYVFDDEEAQMLIHIGVTQVVDKGVNVVTFQGADSARIVLLEMRRPNGAVCPSPETAPPTVPRSLFTCCRMVRPDLQRRCSLRCDLCGRLV